MANFFALLTGLFFIAMAHATASNSFSLFKLSPANLEKINADFLTYKGLWDGQTYTKGNGVSMKTISQETFPALNGMEVSIEMLEFSPLAVNMPHKHPRGAEIMVVMDGVLTIGITDTKGGKMYKKVLHKGDLFLFPMGSTHYQANFDKTIKVIAISIFGSSNAGTIAVAKDMFGADLDDEVLMKGINGVH